ncbi:hypothetical protein CfE428DRAFT_1627 [Chthoniobacter flavus Ellin428]|uniref:Uncharacterized protein n=1 Tax=Chthoniobacter flavus Ellin428 TaxID=497964 RepID=B4CX14_9BACT|nr:hypothetical protein [Chthoniobacter flavus]EDY21334.1 hypothetical protein CfE428DRAFT_1627 [Chthoniobacter flavus Ellin428]TCO84898.1 hypothetical protein EV701_13318 [Chthoniobacter flavus]
MKRVALVILSLGLLGLSSAIAADPISYQEISLLLRTGENQQTILNEAARRKLLEPLTAEQERALRAAGASPALIDFLRAPAAVASAEAVAAYRAHHTTPPPSVSEPNTPVTLFPSETAQALQPANLPNRFTRGLEDAKKAPVGAVHMSDAFNLDSLAAAKAKAQREHKPLGFLMVWNQFFDKRVSARQSGGGNALLHFYEAFKDSLVLVFVHHENELNKVPRAVAAGFGGPDEGGWAPNMAVVDATVSEFIVEIPCAGPNGPGTERDAVFKAGADKIQAWLTTHPNAIAAPVR